VKQNERATTRRGRRMKNRRDKNNGRGGRKGDAYKPVFEVRHDYSRKTEQTRKHQGLNPTYNDLPPSINQRKRTFSFRPHLCPCLLLLTTLTHHPTRNFQRLKAEGGILPPPPCCGNSHPLPPAQVHLSTATTLYNPPSASSTTSPTRVPLRLDSCSEICSETGC